MHAQSLLTLKDIHFNLPRHSDIFQQRFIVKQIAEQYFGDRSSMKRYNLILQRSISRALAIYFKLGDLFSGAKSHNSLCFVAMWKARISGEIN